MSLTCANDPHVGNLYAGAGHRCAFCGDLVVNDPAIDWMAYERLVVHPPCAIQLAIRLLADARRYEKATGQPLTVRPQ